MRQQNLLMPTLREIPSDAEAASHRLMLRAGLIRPLAAGVYTYLPLGRRVLRKAEAIVREEMDRIGAQEVLLPAMQPAELWRESGRYDVYGPELVRLRDRHDREFALGPTHEEVVTALVRDEISSYRKLPLTVYQIQTKFRDERRPRYGLLRGREFLMKDAYSFDTDWEGLDATYRAMYEAYHRIFTRCGLNYRAVEADAGAIGGEGETHEFMALAEIGEDTVVACGSCGYAANLEKAEAAAAQQAQAAADGEAAPPLERWHTPDIRTIVQLTELLGPEASRLMKALLYLADGKPVAVMVRGVDEVSEVKVQRYLGADQLELADADTVQSVTGAPVGFAGPVGLNVPLLVDREVSALGKGIAGANERDYHYRHVRPGRDFSLAHTGYFREVRLGDRCARCDEPLTLHRGIEVGHVFKLDTKYSTALGAKATSISGTKQDIIMGCYGIGVSRLLSAVLEQHHDEQGIVWPLSLAPFHVHIVPVAVTDDAQRELAEELYGRLQAQGVEVLLDDREERPGVKFKDADLIGLPVRIVVGKRAGERVVEYKERQAPEAEQITVEEAVKRVLELVRPAASRDAK
ncbi:proline--tRNA ligase [Paenibacillus sp. MZ04-78.2]|uniref:proline--tRNA ligase n=1 Tax=Paenibacillus sp. MZ04-78.2 TaxID=2962034 RepID=UPI0020B8912C|nr:proline--tRNA ligase [Paenibacillus sp. MZ04-78.2]MCP3775921.1 proline--tRNA ligase [Paenibacillus sp. MZ04-78.2]